MENSASPIPITNNLKRPANTVSPVQPTSSSFKPTTPDHLILETNMQQVETIEEKRERVRKALQGTTQESTNRSLQIEPSVQPRWTINLPVGETGLQNLGNTCFMNSALQCLSHTVPLTVYFLKHLWKDDLNLDNPLGMKGQIPEVYSFVVNNLWNPSEGRLSSFAPRNFKYKIGELNSTFEGYGQQDSHELLQSLLDGLHEDLNRVKKKQYVEDPEIGDLTEDEFAKISWEAYVKRNDSIVVDLFQAQLKSRLECLECGKESIKFDPYMYLQLPIPESGYTFITLIALPSLRGSQAEKARRISVKVKRDATIDQLKISVAQQMNWPQATQSNPSLMLCVEIWQNNVHRNIEGHEKITTIAQNDIICIVELSAPNSMFSNLGTYSDAINLLAGFYSTEKEYPSLYKRPFAPPLLLVVPEKIMFDSPLDPGVARKKVGEICYRLLVRELQRYSKVPLFMATGSSVKASDLKSTQSFENLSHIDLGEGWEPIPDIFTLHLKESGIGDTILYSLDDTNDTYPQKSELENRQSPFSEYSELVNNMDNTLLQSESDDLGKAKLVDSFSFDKSSPLSMMWDTEIATTFFGSGIFQHDHAINDTNPFNPIEDPSISRAIALEEEKKITLEQCISEFNREELLEGDDIMYCSKCKEHRPTKKRLTVYSFPDILVIQLKRFSNQGRLRSKIGGFIDAPIRGLDASQFLLSSDGVQNDSLLYDLFAVSNHFGGLGGGHYTAYCLNPIDNQWYDCDDSRVSKLQGPIMTPAAYLLFYQRRTMESINMNQTLDFMRKELHEKANILTGSNIPSTDSDLATANTSIDNFAEIPLNSNLYSSNTNSVLNRDSVDELFDNRTATPPLSDSREFLDEIEAENK